MPRPLDTAPDVEERMFEIYRAMPVERKLRILRDAYRTMRLLHSTGFVQQHPGANRSEIQRDWINKTWGESPSTEIAEAVDVQSLDNVAILQRALDAFRKLGIPFAIGGSWASSVYGEPRSTLDVDLAAAPFPGQEEQLAKEIGDDFYCSVESMRAANRERSCFNLLHTTSGFKIDVFVQKDRVYDRMLLTRSSLRSLPDGTTLPLVSPEDIVLLKLEWYRIGGEVSDQQWRDIRGVLKARRGDLDEEYLDHWAAELGVRDLLQNAQLDS
jgi:hypothetical protein